MSRDLPKRVYRKHGAFWHVDTHNKWHRLCAIKEGLPTMYRALATLTEAEATSDKMPAVITRWLDDRRGEWAAATKRNNERQAQVMADSLVEFTPRDMTTPACREFLQAFTSRPRTHNQYRSMLRQVLSFAALEGLRDGWNPVDDVPQKKTPGRRRIVTDEEVAAIKAAALLVRNGKALVQMIDLALLTGQRISDLLKLRWQDVSDAGISVEQGKTKERLLIEWTPHLKVAMAECARGGKIGFVLKTQSKTGYTYAGIRSSWVRACERAGVIDLNIHDLRGRAGVDKTEAHGKEEAQKLLGHRSMRMTEHYVEGKSAKRVTPSK